VNGANAVFHQRHILGLVRVTFLCRRWLKRKAREKRREEASKEVQGREGKVLTSYGNSIEDFSAVEFHTKAWGGSVMY